MRLRVRAFRTSLLRPRLAPPSACSSCAIVAYACGALLSPVLQMTNNTAKLFCASVFLFCYPIFYSIFSFGFLDCTFPSFAERSTARRARRLHASTGPIWPSACSTLGQWSVRCGFGRRR
ncbi:hypothetical protein [Pandoravirus japonicus]|uniref:Uncharacterized protein n=1 Tax=Pandoravirus japonicus TaxID=2823154 RepID=A0A811BMQ3_9VIRU|nr:hypothetical protein [Pandoravirus japonicus]